MFDELKLQRPVPRSLALQSRIGQNIANEIAQAPEARQVAKYEKYRAKHTQWKNRRGACGVYNCYGHIFASRRTAVYEDVEVSKILADDGYRRVAHQTAHVGDVAIYKASHGFVHAAQIVEIGSACPITNLRPIWALSKWDDGSGEDSHLLNDVPFEYAGEIEIWTDRN